MAPSRPSKPSQTKGKRAPHKSGIANSKAAARRTPADGIVSRSRSQIKKQQSTAGKPKKPSAPSLAEILKKRKPKTYAEKDLDLPTLNTVVPAGVTKPKGQKKGKVFVDDREGMATILALVQAEQDGQIESRMARARQLEEVREARRAEAEKKEGERRAALDDVKESLRKKRRRPAAAAEPKKVNENNINELAVTGTRAAKTSKKRKSVSFAE